MFIPCDLRVLPKYPFDKTYLLLFFGQSGPHTTQHLGDTGHGVAACLLLHAGPLLGQKHTIPADQREAVMKRMYVCSYAETTCCRLNWTIFIHVSEAFISACPSPTLYNKCCYDFISLPLLRMKDTRTRHMEFHQTFDEENALLNRKTFPLPKDTHKIMTYFPTEHTIHVWTSGKILHNDRLVVEVDSYPVEGGLGGRGSVSIFLFFPFVQPPPWRRFSWRATKL